MTSMWPIKGLTNTSVHCYMIFLAESVDLNIIKKFDKICVPYSVLEHFCSMWACNYEAMHPMITLNGIYVTFRRPYKCLMIPPDSGWVSKISFDKKLLLQISIGSIQVNLSLNFKLIPWSLGITFMFILIVWKKLINLLVISYHKHSGKHPWRVIPL